MSAADRLREKANEYELNALAQRDLGNAPSSEDFNAVAIALTEVADALEHEAEAA